ncbi:unnamed protein product [Polarella glacialis]|uniref:Uncharacterized protein n=1 Tax=Polarella glacialis TaxID=89957 RepID=A0A813JVQ2_POLGL|nr:unnamed protein product [Polarella glacialis]CAE8687736.1 unnamed protein product [Polarella glacialis]
MDSHKQQCNAVCECSFCHIQLPKAGLAHHMAQCYHATSCEGCGGRFHSLTVARNSTKCQSSYEWSCRADEQKRGSYHRQGSSSSSSSSSSSNNNNSPDKHKNKDQHRSEGQQRHGLQRSYEGQKHAAASPSQCGLASTAPEDEGKVARIQFAGRLSGMDAFSRKRMLRALQKCRNHPDKNTGKEVFATEMFRFVQSQWDVEFK